MNNVTLPPSGHAPSETPKKKRTRRAWILMILSLIYTISPLDLIPDSIPIAGWIEDATLIVGAVLNLAQASSNEDNKVLVTILMYAKWLVLILGAIGLLVVLLLGMLIYKVAS